MIRAPTMQLHRNGITLAYDQTGHDAPPLVLVHGWGMNRSVFGPLAEHLVPSHRIVTLDLRGFGESDTPEQPYTIETFSDDLAFLITELHLESPIVLGHSLGGMITLDFAARHADKLSAAIILEGPVVPPNPLATVLGPLLESIRGENYREALTAFLNHLVGPHFDPAERTRLTEIFTSCPHHVLVSSFEHMIAFDSVAAASQVTCPLLYVGTQTRYADTQEFRKLCPQLKLGQLVGCGHYFPLEVPDQLAPMLTRFIQTEVTHPKPE